MKIKTAVRLVWDAIDKNDYATALILMRKYRRRFGNRHFNCWMRLNIANGLWLQSIFAH